MKTAGAGQAKQIVQTLGDIQNFNMLSNRSMWCQFLLKWTFSVLSGTFDKHPGLVKSAKRTIFPWRSQQILIEVGWLASMTVGEIDGPGR